ncbi:MAG: hypothetical protein M1133_14495 [Armatimonadetes bacterium]|nr:hypothetical protein [Armatimonadota bacterium]
MRYILVCLIAAMMLAGLPCGGFAQQGDTEMSVTAEGSAAVTNKDIAKAEDEALADAKRNAVEAAVGVFVKAETLGKNYQVVEENILTKSEGYIASWSKVEGSRGVKNVEGNQLLTIKISAKVKLTSLISDMSNIEEIYNAMQRPKVMVLVREECLGKPCPDLPVSAQAIMRSLQDRKFDVVDPEVIKRVIQKQSVRLMLEKGDTKAAAALAEDEGAEILVLGTAKAVETKGDDFTGGEVKSCSATVSARLVYADTGEVLFTPKLCEGRGASFSDASEAATTALDQAGGRLITADSKRFTEQVLASWARQVQNGRVLRLVASNISYDGFSALKGVIRDFRGHVEFVGQPKYTGKTATFSVRTKLTPEAFRDRLSGAKVGKKKIVIESITGAVTCLALK